METFVVGGVLLGAAWLLRKRDRDDGDDDGHATNVVVLPPTAPSASNIPNPSFGGDDSRTRISDVPVMPNRSSDGSADMSKSLGDRLRWMPPPTPTKSNAAVVGQMFSPSLNAVDNVHVRTRDVTRTELQHMQRPRAQNNALPFQQIMVGPGVGIGADAAAGDQGYHYGVNRMRPNDVHVHQRGQRGGIVAGKAGIDKPTSTPHVRKLRPDRFFEVSEEYHTAAPGRSSATAATVRTEPHMRHTNRATETFGTGPAASVTVNAVTDRYAYGNFTDTSQRGQKQPDVGQPSLNMGAGYVISEQNMSVHDNQRTTTQHAGQSLIPIDNPGQPIFQPSRSTARATLRAGTPALPVSNLALSVPDAHPREIAQPLRTTDRQLTQFNDYTGPAQSRLTVSSEQMQIDSVAQGRMSKPTLKEMTHEPYTGNARPALSNPTSYAELLSAEGYSNKVDEETDRMANPGRTNIPANKEFTRFQLAEEPPNAARGSNLQRSTATNLYVRNDILDVSPNKDLPDLDRLDASILTDNELYPQIR